MTTQDTTAPYAVTFWFPVSEEFFTLTLFAALPKGDPIKAAQLAADIQGWNSSWVHTVTELTYDDCEKI